ncbi:hypothetical protein IPG41_05175 [Candidatus Peregrinibacteria bacterium]|nr:MAG: hypothetical protein IPG41_05175 [Candidatus Peregrinibacteria bacterium]
MPLHVEISAGGNWREIGVLEPGVRPGSMSNIKDDGTREIYIFECNRNDRDSTVFRSRAGVDIVEGVTREVLSTHFDIVQTLAAGESLELNIRGPRMQKPNPVRFSHRTPGN